MYGPPGDRTQDLNFIRVTRLPLRQRTKTSRKPDLHQRLGEYYLEEFLLQSPILLTELLREEEVSFLLCSEFRTSFIKRTGIKIEEGSSYHFKLEKEC